MIAKIIFLPFYLIVLPCLYFLSSAHFNTRMDAFFYFFVKKSIYPLQGVMAYLLYERKRYALVCSFFNVSAMSSSSGLLLLSIALSRRATGKVDELTIEILRASVDKAPTLLKNYFAFKYISILRETRRVRLSELAFFNAILASPKTLYLDFYHRACLELSAEYLCQSSCVDAKKWYLKGSASSIVASSYLALTYYFNESFNKPEVSKLVVPGKSLIDILKEAEGSICVVGNSPDVVGSEAGEWVDSHDVVIRFNNYNVGPEFVKDIGIKTDVWVRMLPTPLIKRNVQGGLDMVVFTGPNAVHRAINKWPEVIKISSQVENAVFFDINLFFELQSMIGSPPSSGLMVCFTIYRTFGSLSRNQLLGLTVNGSVGEGGVYHYSDGNAFAAPRHNWKKEALIYDEMFSGKL